jgi:hypothetical protein
VGPAAPAIVRLKRALHRGILGSRGSRRRRRRGRAGEPQMVAKPRFDCQFRRRSPVCYAPRSRPPAERHGWGFLPKFSTPVEKIVENEGFTPGRRPQIRLGTGI